jgi:hypothetical protein
MINDIDITYEDVEVALPPDETLEKVERVKKLLDEDKSQPSRQFIIPPLG